MQESFQGDDSLFLHSTRVYRPGKANVVADALTRKHEDLKTQRCSPNTARHNQGLEETGNIYYISLENARDETVI
jgi:hypothetical protein